MGGNHFVRYIRKYRIKPRQRNGHFAQLTTCSKSHLQAHEYGIGIDNKAAGCGHREIIGYLDFKLAVADSLLNSKNDNREANILTGIPTSVKKILLLLGKPRRWSQG